MKKGQSLVCQALMTRSFIVKERGVRYDKTGYDRSDGAESQDFESRSRQGT
jgi:hypothetical protein